MSLIERVARHVFEDGDTIFDDMCYVSSDLQPGREPDESSDDLFCIVDGRVNLSALVRSALTAIQDSGDETQDKLIKRLETLQLDVLKLPNGNDAFDTIFAAIGRITALATANAQLMGLEERLADPVVVHVNMLRGGIAKPSPANIWHIYGKELLDAMPDEYRGEVEGLRAEAARLRGWARLAPGPADRAALYDRVMARHLPQPQQELAL